MLRWIYERSGFWGLACHACNRRNGWRTSFCDWRSNSYIAVATCRHCGAEQLLKKYRLRGTINTTCPAQWEYEVLRHLNGGDICSRSFLLPQAYKFTSTTCVLSMEYLKGENMEERMRRVDRKGFDDCLRLSAAWLRGLHRTPPLLGKMGSDSGTMLLRLESDCEAMAGRDTMVAEALMCMRSNLVSVSSVPVVRVPLHGDFKASNLIWTPRGVYGIDVGLHFKNPGVMDAAQFVANVLLNRRNITSVASEHDATAILDVFLEAYGDNTEQNRKLTTWWLQYFLLSRWQEDLEGWKPSMYVDRSYASALADVMAL